MACAFQDIDCLMGNRPGRVSFWKNEVPHCRMMLCSHVAHVSQAVDSKWTLTLKFQCGHDPAENCGGGDKGNFFNTYAPGGFAKPSCVVRCLHAYSLHALMPRMRQDFDGDGEDTVSACHLIPDLEAIEPIVRK